MKDIKDFSREELVSFFNSIGEPNYRATELFQAIYKQKVDSFLKITTLPIEVRQRIASDFLLKTFKGKPKKISTEDTTKFLFMLHDGNFIETVVMTSEDKFGTVRTTVCLSTQVGCSFSCTFCATGKMGLIRNLGTGEILEQLLEAEFLGKVNNVVFMGMGEPLLNYQNVRKAIEIISDEAGFAIGRRKITISTSGIPARIRDLADELRSVKLAISLHSAIQQKRNTLMPDLRTISLKDLKESLDYYTRKTGNTITLEYILLDNVNDGKEDLLALVNFAKALKFVKVNLIHYNAQPELSFKPSEKEIWFQKALLEKKIRATLRVSKGEEIRAACGQLYTKHNSQRL